MSDAPRFAILRTQKLKHLGSVRRSLKHSFRDQDTPNADQSRTPENSHFGAGSTAEAMDAIEARLPEKRRSDAVLAIEYLVTASPEAMHGKTRAEQDAYFADSLEWLKQRHGADNVVYAGIHRDETTPHMYAYVVPLDPESGRLNAKKWLGGSQALTKMQTDFASEVGESHGLERGIERSKAQHTTIRDYYARVQQEAQKAPKVDVPEPTVGERLNPRAYGERVARDVIEQMMPAWREMSAKASEHGQALKAAEAARAAQKAHSERLRPVEDAFRGLSLKGQKQLLYIVQGASERVKAADQQQGRKVDQAQGQSRGGPIYRDGDGIER